MSDVEPPATPSAHPGTHHLVQSWVSLWNGDADIAPTLLDEHLILHMARADGVQDDTGPAALTSWVSVIRTLVPDLVFDIEVGPFTDGDVIVLRWVATGHYATGFPGATAPAGAPVSFTGTDILRTADHRVAEYWVNADIHVLLTQVGILPS